MNVNSICRESSQIDMYFLFMTFDDKKIESRKDSLDFPEEIGGGGFRLIYQSEVDLKSYSKNTKNSQYVLFNILFVSPGYRMLQGSKFGIWVDMVVCSYRKQMRRVCCCYFFFL